MPKLKKIEADLGQIFIADRALEMIVYGALLQVEGLKTPDRLTPEGVWGRLAKVYKGNGIQILKDSPADTETETEAIEPRLHVKLDLVAQYGVKIHQAAAEAVREVRRRVKELAGLEVDEVSIKVIGIAQPPEDHAPAS